MKFLASQMKRKLENKNFKDLKAKQKKEGINVCIYTSYIYLYVCTHTPTYN